MHQKKQHEKTVAPPLAKQFFVPLRINTSLESSRQTSCRALERSLQLRLELDWLHGSYATQASNPIVFNGTP